MTLTVGLGPAASDLQPGDVLMERNHGTLTHGAITFGQALGGVFSFGRTGKPKYSKTVHAAIYTGDSGAGGLVAESVGGGLRENEIGNGRSPNQRVDWKVYRFNDPAVIDMAVDVALNLVKRAYEDPERFDGSSGRAYGAYTKGASFASAFSKAGRRQRRGAASDASFGSVARQRGFFCSNFVAACYAVASEMTGHNAFYAIPRNMEQVNPAELDGFFKKSGNWTRVGGGRTYIHA